MVRTYLRGVALTVIVLAGLTAAAPHPGRQAPAACEDPPLSLADIRSLLSQYVPPARVAQRIRGCGVTFILAPDDESSLRRAGADDQVIALLRPPANPRPGATWTAPTDRRELTWIPAGTFRMGSPDTERERDADEPGSSVTLGAGFWMDTAEVSKAEFRRFLLANPAWRKEAIARTHHDGNYLKEWNGTSFPAAEGDWPVVNVSWPAAAAYAQWAGRRLPTEAEWEYAARAGTVTAYWWGDAFDAARGNNTDQVQPVRGGTPARNPWGLLHMLGNVSEWTASPYRPYPYREAAPDAAAPPAERVARGGAWNHNAKFLRAANRFNLTATATSDQVGFRCAY